MPSGSEEPGDSAGEPATRRPLARALEILGRRWALRILFELRGESVGARQLIARCDGMSSSVLYERLRELSELGVVTQDGRRYTATDAGRQLLDILEPIEGWADEWLEDDGQESAEDA